MIVMVRKQQGGFGNFSPFCFFLKIDKLFLIYRLKKILHVKTEISIYKTAIK